MQKNEHTHTRTHLPLILTTQTTITSNKKAFPLDMFCVTGLQAYSWTSGVPVTYTNWEANEPNYGNEVCVTTERPYNFQWADVSCDRKEASLCKAKCPKGTSNIIRSF